MTKPTHPSPVDFNLYLITDRNNTCGRQLGLVVEETLKGGVKAVQLREKDLTSRELYGIARELRVLTNRYSARLFINDRVDIALAVDADGVHLGAGSMPLDQARLLLGCNRLIGCSCHDGASALAAQREGADFITFGPVFYTPSKAVYGPPVGVESLGEAARLLHIPVFALGGINRSSVPRTIAAGARGIALISALMAAEDPRRESLELLSLLHADSRET